jgi:hypothetical protein
MELNDMDANLPRLDVTFDVYSGRPNPSITLTGADAEHQLSMLAPGDEIGPADPADPPSQLGYRGIVFDWHGTPRAGLPATFRLIAGRLLGPGLRHWIADPSVEDLICSAQGLAGLIWTRPEPLATLSAELAAARTRQWWAADESPPSTESPTPCPGAPDAALGQWNDAKARGLPCTQLGPDWCRQCVNNCYNYATNTRSDSFGQPGYASGFLLPPSQIAVATVQRYSFYDGLLDATYATGTSCLGGLILVALALDLTPGRQDYHWWRRNSDGYWSHKPGWGAATDKDSSHNLIIDPSQCNRGRYTTWGGYLVVTPGGVRISGQPFTARTEAPLPDAFRARIL